MFKQISVMVMEGGKQNSHSCDTSISSTINQQVSQPLARLVLNF